MNKTAIVMIRGMMIGGVMIGGPLAAAHAQSSLQDAIATACAASPVLQGQLATAAGTAEGSVQARAGWQPQVTLNATGGYIREPYNSIDYGQGSVDSNNAQAALNVTQPLYTGGKLSAQIAGADASRRAGDQAVRATAATLVQNVVGAYMDVLRDSTITAIRRADLATLQRQFADTQARFKLGNGVTRTDVAQAETGAQTAAAALAQANMQLDASRAEYAAVVGVDPGTADFRQPDDLPGLPASLADALRRAAASNPALAQSEDGAAAAAAAIDAARAAGRPDIQIQASVGTIGPMSPFHTGQYQETAQAMLVFNQAIYSGGLIGSEIRQAEDAHEAAAAASDQVARQTVQAVAAAWSGVHNGNSAIAASRAAVQAAQLALAGAQAEYQYGLRSTLDVLIADQNLRAAQVALIQAQHDATTAQAALLAATGGAVCD